MPPFPNIWTIGLTFDPDLWPDRREYQWGSSTKQGQSEASWTKRSGVIRSTRYWLLVWPLTLTSDLLSWISIGVIYLSRTIYLPSSIRVGQSVPELSVCTRWSRQAWPLILAFDLLTWILIGVIFSSRTINLPSLKPEEKSVLELSVAHSEVDWHDLWSRPLTYWPEYQYRSYTNQGLSTYQVWSLWDKAFLSYQLH